MVRTFLLVQNGYRMSPAQVENVKVSHERDHDVDFYGVLPFFNYYYVDYNNSSYYSVSSFRMPSFFI